MIFSRPMDNPEPHLICTNEVDGRLASEESKRAETLRGGRTRSVELNAFLPDATAVLSANRPRLVEQSTACHRASP